jgi:TolA-binding protein
VKSLRPIVLLAASAAIALLPASALAQRQPPSPDQRLERLERQIQQIQRQVFPRGRPASTAGFADEPAATQSSVATLDQRLDALERQMTDLVRQSEENGHRLQTLQSDLAKARADQEQRISTLEQRVSEAAAPPPGASFQPADAEPPAAKPAVRPSASKPAAKATAKPKNDASLDTDSSAEAAATPPEDAGEDAYSEGFHQWEAGDYDQAIASLRAFTAAYPKHRRVSFANNLIGRALLDKGQPRAAAEALLANYRNDPGGERAPDSLFYLGQALLKLGQPAQACKAYAELDAVYGAKVRSDLRAQVEEAEAAAQCG